VTVELIRTGAAGPSATPIDDIRGAVDPRGAAPADGPPAGARVTFGPDPRYAYVGWAARDHPVWKAGIIVVDVETGTIVQRVALPDRSDGEGDSRTAAVAPGVVGLAGDGRLLVVAPWYRWSPAMSQNPTFHVGSDVFAATADAGSLGALAPFAAGAQCGDQVMRAGALPDGGTWLACLGAGGSQTIVRRIAAAGTVNETRVAGGGDLGSDALGTSTISPDGRHLYAWDPIAGTLNGVDLVTGTVTSGLASTAAGAGPLAALGRWLTPTAAAKVFLSSGIAVSPDGSRVYVLGLEPGAASSHDFGGSTGIFVFDAATLAQVGHWNPTADYVSLAVSADGRFVYAAGGPGTTSGGTAGVAAASVTVFEASTGTVRLIAGQLGHALLLFPATTVP
jgi:DNA-binding beta-propeller fold protein YncE